MKYERNVLQFARWVWDNEEDQGDNIDDYEEFDDLLCDYIHHLYDSDRGYSPASMTVHGIIHLLPEIRHHLPRSKQALKGWLKGTPTSSYPPLTWELTCAIAMRLIENGFERYGVGMLFAFDCFLRVGELCNIRRCDVADTGDLRIGVEHTGMVIRLRKTKTGNNKWVTVEQPELIVLMRHLLDSSDPTVTSTADPNERLFPFTTDQFRRRMQQACKELKLPVRYVPHSLRHGGATRYYHVLKWTLEDVLFRGRWASNDSARRYIQTGMALLLSFKHHNHDAMTFGATVAKDLFHFIALAQKRHLATSSSTAKSNKQRTRTKTKAKTKTRTRK